MFTVLQRHVSTHMSHLQARTILVYKVIVLILGSQTLTCLFHRFIAHQTKTPIHTYSKYI